MSSPETPTVEIDAILRRTYRATSEDGTVAVEVSGDGRMVGAQVAEGSGSCGDAATEAVRAAMEAASRHTAWAMADLPGLNPQLRALLLSD